MKTWRRITLVTLVLIGSAFSFASWSLKQFDDALAALQAPQVAAVIVPRQPRLHLGAAPATTTASTTVASPASSAIVLGSLSKEKVMFPGKGSKAYVGCTYTLAVHASSTVTALELALVGAGTQTPVPATTSGLSRPQALTAARQQVTWKVGSVWPGVYYLSLDTINGTPLSKRSYTFTIGELPAGLEDGARKSLCESTGGSL
jgi:hypothetical protein